MADRPKGMGRGLAAILSVAPRDDEEELRRLPVELIDANPRQPRRTFEEEALTGLAESVRSQGILQPVLVRPLPGGRYELVAGERRLRAAKLAELAEIPAVVRRHDDAASLELALVENMVRADLTPVEEARACAALVEDLGLTREEVGRRVGRSRVAVSNLIRLLDLPDEALALLDSGHLSEGHGRALLTVDDHGIRRALARGAAAEGWSVRELERRAREVARPDRPAEPRTSGRSRRRRPAAAIHPDQEDAMARIGDMLGTALGRDLDVTPSSAAGAYRVTIEFASADEALELARRLGMRSVA